jgi:hypothetical protein
MECIFLTFLQTCYFLNWISNLVNFTFLVLVFCYCGGGGGGCFDFIWFWFSISVSILEFYSEM